MAAVSSQLWEDRNRAASSSPQPSAPARATPNRPKPQGPALPSVPGPAAAHGTVTRGINEDAAALQEGKDKADAQNLFQTEASISEQQPPSAETIKQEGVSERPPGNSERQEGGYEGPEGQSKTTQGISDRESRAAARLSRLAQSATHTSQESKADHESQSKRNIGKVLGFSFCSFMTACLSQGVQSNKVLV